MMKTIHLALATAALAALAVPAEATVPVYYSVTDLGTLGGTFSEANDINDLGQVVGKSVTAAGASRGFFWDSSTGMIDLGVLGGNSAASTAAFALNNNGQVVGQSGTLGDYHAFVWTSATGMAAIGELPGDRWSIANDINDAGQIVGVSEFVGNGYNTSHPFLWTPGEGMVNPGDKTGGVARGINATGIAAGESGSEAILYFGGYAFEMGFLPGDAESDALAINDSWQVVGGSSTGGFFGGNPQAFLWTAANGMTSLGNLTPGDPHGESLAKDINNLGQVVGWSYLSMLGADHAFLWDSSTGMIDLNTLIDPLGGWTLSAANGINELGQIVGYGYSNSDPSIRRAFLLTPQDAWPDPVASVPEPATWALMILGFAAVGFQMRRRIEPARVMVSWA